MWSDDSDDESSDSLVETPTKSRGPRTLPCKRKRDDSPSPKPDRWAEYRRQMREYQLQIEAEREKRRQLRAERRPIDLEIREIRAERKKMELEAKQQLKQINLETRRARLDWEQERRIWYKCILRSIGYLREPMRAETQRLQMEMAQLLTAYETERSIDAQTLLGRMSDLLGVSSSDPKPSSGSISSNMHDEASNTVSSSNKA